MFEFEIEKPEDLPATIAFLRKEAAKNKIEVIGDDRSGKCSGHGFEGQYEITETVRITVFKKPIFVSESRVIDAVRDYLKKIREEGLETV